MRLYKDVLLSKLFKERINLLADKDIKVTHMNIVDIYETVLHNLNSGASVDVLKDQFRHDIARLRKMPERVLVDKKKLEVLKVFYSVFTTLVDLEPEATLASKTRTLRLRLKQDLPDVQNMGEVLVEHRGPCVGCGTETHYFCPFCHAYGQVVSYLCEKEECREKHEQPDGHGCYRTHFDAKLVGGKA